MKKYFLNRLKEPSTYLGLIQFSVAFGIVHFSPEQTDAVTSIVMIIAGSGVVGMIAPDKQHHE